jgi:hypothetical protein
MWQKELQFLPVHTECWNSALPKSGDVRKLVTFTASSMMSLSGTGFLETYFFLPVCGSKEDNDGVVSVSWFVLQGW